MGAHCKTEIHLDPSLKVLLSNKKMKIWLVLFAALKLIHIIKCSSYKEREAAEEDAFREKVKRMLAGIPHQIIHSRITLIFDVSKPTVTRSAAEKKCKNRGGELVSVTSERKARAMERYISTSTRCWISAIKVHNLWKWGSGELIRPGVRKMWTYPATSSYPNYIGMVFPWKSGSFQFLNMQPSSTYYTACEVDGKLRAERGNMMSTTMIYQKTTFVFVKSFGINFTTAKSDCENLNKPGKAHLAAPTSFKELELIDKYMNKTASNNYWLGAKRNYFSDDDKWLTGEPIAPNLRNFPNDNGGSCLIYNYRAQMFDYIDCFNSFIPRGYICQMDTEKTYIRGMFIDC